MILKNKIVSANFTGHSYITESDRSSGLRVNASSASEGTVVDVAGTLSTVDGERAITSASVAVVSSRSAPLPLGVVGRDLGGGASGLQPGVLNGFGLNNIGLLVTVWGHVNQIGDGHLYIDDGSALRDGTLTGAEENIGVRVICDPTDYHAGDYLIVTGISSCFETPSGLARPADTRAPDGGRAASLAAMTRGHGDPINHLTIDHGPLTINHSIIWFQANACLV